MISASASSRSIPAPSVYGKYRITARLLGEMSGTLLDVGARDRRLARSLPAGQFAYRSADVQSGHDYRIELEGPLPFADGAFDVVVALDCLEHVERLHAAFAELLRITRRTAIIALPNMASWPHAVALLRRGRLATDKYDLSLQAPRDRHRWLTVLEGCDRFVAGAIPATHRLDRVVHELEGGRVARAAGWLVHGLGRGRHLAVARSIYRIVRVTDVASRTEMAC